MVEVSNTEMLNRKKQAHGIDTNSMYEMDVPNSTLDYAALQQLSNGGVPVERPKISIALNDSVNTDGYTVRELCE